MPITDSVVAPVDDRLCPAGFELLARLNRTSGQHALFGHQSDELVARNSGGAASDVLEATGTYPAVSGFELGGLERFGAGDYDTEYFERVRNAVRQDYRRGGIITVSWHSVNPITGGGYGQNLAHGSVAAVLPGGSSHKRYRQWLDAFAQFALSLTDDEGALIPIVFRPFHEHNGDWFWWCVGGRGESEQDVERLRRHGQSGQFGPEADAAEEDFAALWRYVVTYLRDQRGVHNLLYAISPDRSRIRLDRATFTEDYLRGYPGDGFVDIFGLDDYIDIGRQDNPGDPGRILAGFELSLEELARVAQAHGKLPAMTEVGTPNALAGVPDRPWTQFLDRAAASSALTRRVLWYLAWTNSWHDEVNIYGTPLSHERTGPDFRRFAREGYIRFLDRAELNAWD
ncbi:glycoside hydrolase family 26 protein [Bifidobacterium sp.]|jgi:mannan endo-1,4-beta-mannosidase|uniref:glycoside hydrolase family 26 protein n=1 Tax=Bifidobacterium sp. TaxID=41200 RepID=UPI0025C5F66E|nr:glycosyl hydrolase [Bifidobacterium sp.]MCH4209420.1 glycoside hydrolase family 26 protein [Bifidobacterium sp.]MCI1224998.1 glycoside hydrolase family 26 protein [Bifidobacterium sp.]